MNKTFIVTDKNGIKLISSISLIKEKYGDLIETSIKQILPREYLHTPFRHLENMLCDHFICRYPILNSSSENKREIFKQATQAFQENRNISEITNTPATTISISLPTRIKDPTYLRTLVDTPYPVKVIINNHDMSHLFGYLDKNSSTRVQDAHTMMFNRKFLLSKYTSICETDFIDSVMHQIKDAESKICAGSEAKEKE